MNRNLGKWDRGIRLVIAAFLAYFGLKVYVGSALGIGLTVVAAILALTGIFGFCALYRLFGISTRKVNQTAQS
ncbi:YgaP family membrane protein [Fischerella sp. PCC 9605]|uniref:YgaP family membrane protein n=1 Tax=Fischerella sp. PCC 9605 TaxID=1173024 RepID=UPI00047C8EDD|nr:DUF2892 domain-containing protein [Fischerella sp. PCC 9605]